MNTPTEPTRRLQRATHATRLLMVVVPLMILAGCVLNPVDNPALDGTTWEVTSTVGGLSPSLALDYVALNETVIVTFGRRMRWNSAVGGFAYYKFKPYE